MEWNVCVSSIFKSRITLHKFRNVYMAVRKIPTQDPKILSLPRYVIFSFGV